MAISERQRDAMRLALEINCHAVTAERWLNGQPVSETYRYALAAAAEKLGIEPPAAPVEAAS